MAYTIRKDERLKSNIAEALDYYDAVSFKLGERFELELTAAFYKAQTNPHYYFNLNSKCRPIILESFPYMIIYIVNEAAKEVIVAGLFHHHGSKAAIKNRLR